jgi:membrane protein DedA with SNARE-associated domain
MSTECLEQFIRNYGYWALFFGTLLEGETILVIGGLIARLGYLDLPMVMLVSFLGSFTGDQFFYHLGRIKGKELLERHLKWQRRVEKIHLHIERYHDLIMIGFRFVYGMRIMTPIVIGMCKNIKISRFTTLNTIGAVLWSIIIAAGGYFFGYAIEGFLNDVKHYEFYAVSVVAIIGCILWLFHRLRDK